MTVAKSVCGLNYVFDPILTFEPRKMLTLSPARKVFHWLIRLQISRLRYQREKRSECVCLIFDFYVYLLSRRISLEKRSFTYYPDFLPCAAIKRLADIKVLISTSINLYPFVYLRSVSPSGDCLNFGLNVFPCHSIAFIFVSIKEWRSIKNAPFSAFNFDLFSCSGNAKRKNSHKIRFTRGYERRSAPQLSK